jgi:orotate phosphoribosyltransferase
MMNMVLEKQQRISELLDHQRKVYATSMVEERLQAIVRESPCSSLSKNDVIRIFRDSKAVVFDTHVAVVSGHHTTTYLGFEAIARYPHMISIISHDMGQWLLGLSQHHRIDGLLVPASDARFLVEGIATVIKGRMPVRLVHAPFNAESGKIGTDIPEGIIRKGENFVVINDVTARGNCVHKLGTMVSDHGGHVVGMMVFARRDCGQFPLMDDLMSHYPFYYGTNVMMPQWESQNCPNCQRGEAFFSWKEMPV